MTLSALRGRLVNPAAHAGEAGIWRLGGDGPEAISRFDVGPAVLLVPAEQVLLLTVDLPIASPRRRLESLPFAIEDRIAARTDTVHMAIGAEVAPRRYLAAVVDQAVMRGWVEALEAAGLDHCAIVPDSLAVPMPPEGAWNVAVEDGRALVRTEDGGGFALPAAQFGIAWGAAGRPRLLASGEALPAELEAEPAPAAEPLAERLRTPALDLRQGLYARKARRAPHLWRRVAVVAAAGVAAHAAIAAADTAMLARIAAEREAETRALLAVASPSAATSADLVGDAAALLPAPSAPPGAFMPVLSRASAALAPLGGTVTLQSLRFGGGALVLGVSASDTAGFARAVEALRGAGLTVSTQGAGPQGSVRIEAAGA